MPSEEWRRHPVVKDLCVVGHGRGATSYAAYWLIKQGLQMNHERLGKQGIVESGFSVPTWGCRAGVHQGLTRDYFTFLHKVAIVRDPYKVIATYEQVEHPRAIFNHVEHVPGLVDGLLPPDWNAMPPEQQIDILDNDRLLRVNTIARSVARWTQMGIDWCGGNFFRAEKQWNQEMPRWLKSRGLWLSNDLSPRAVPRNYVNHRKGTRLTQAEIMAFLRPDVQAELDAYRKVVGYA